MKCNRPNEARCCSISFDSSQSSVTLKGGAYASDVPPVMATMQRTSSADIELTTISNEIDRNTDATNDLIESTDASNNDYNTTPSLNDEQQSPQITTIAPEEIHSSVDDDEQRRREEIQQIFASKEFNGTNPSYLQIINNSPTLLVYATSKDDWDAAYVDNLESNSIVTTEQSTNELPTESPEFDSSSEFNSDEISSTENPSFEANNVVNADAFVSTMEHDNLTEVHHGIKRQSIYNDQPEYYETENEYEELDDGNDFNQPGESDEDEYFTETDYDMEHEAHVTAVQSLLTTMQKQSVAAQKPVINRFNTLQQMVENSKKQFGSALGQTDIRNNYNLRSKKLTTTTTSTTTTQTPRVNEDRETNRKYLQRQLPAAAAVESSISAKPKIAAKTSLPTNERDTQSMQNFHSRNRLRTKSTNKNVELESSSSSSLPKSVDEFHDNSSQLRHMALEKRNQLFNSKRRNILAERHQEMTSPQPEMTTTTTTTTTSTTTTPKSTEFMTEIFSSTRKPNRNHASHNRFRFRQNHQLNGNK